MTKEWNIFSESKPPIGKKVLVWRSGKEKYGVFARRINEENDYEYWNSEYSMCLTCEPEDRWKEFTYVKIEKEFN